MRQPTTIRKATIVRNYPMRMMNMTTRVIEQHKQVRRKQEQEAKLDLRPVTFYVDFNDANLEFFKQYGVVTSNLIYKLNNEYKKTREKGYFEFEPRNISATEAFRRFLKIGEVGLPHKVAAHEIHRAIDNFNKFGASDEFGELNLVSEQEAHQGFTHYWKFVSKKRHLIDPKVNDVVQFGVSFRNGIGTLTSLGGDLYSYRLWCANGAVTTDRRFSFSIPHRYSAARMLEQFRDSIANLIMNYKTLLEYYKESTKIKLNQAIALAVIKKAEIPLKYLSPQMFDITLPSEKNELKHAVIKLSKRGKDSTLWDLFNSLTQPISRSAGDTFTQPTNTNSLYNQHGNKMGKIVYSSFVERTAALHRAMFQQVEAVAPLAVVANNRRR